MEVKIKVQKNGKREIVFGTIEYELENDDDFYSEFFQDLMDNVLINFKTLIDCFSEMSDDNIPIASLMESVLRDVSLQIDKIIEFLDITLGRIEFKFRRRTGASVFIPEPVALNFLPSEYLTKEVISGLTPRPGVDHEI